MRAQVERKFALAAWGDDCPDAPCERTSEDKRYAATPCSSKYRPAGGVYRLLPARRHADGRCGSPRPPGGIDPGSSNPQECIRSIPDSKGDAVPRRLFCRISRQWKRSRKCADRMQRAVSILRANGGRPTPARRKRDGALARAPSADESGGF